MIIWEESEASLGQGSRDPEVFLLRRRGSGSCVEGRGFYIWHEDPAEVVRFASELRPGNPQPWPTRRMLILTPEASLPAPTPSAH